MLTKFLSFFLVVKLNSVSLYILSAAGTTPSTPQRVIPNVGPKSSTVGSTGISTTTAPNVGSKTGSVSSSSIPAVTAPRRNLPKIHAAPNTSFFNKSDGVSVIVPRNSARLEQAAELRREGVSGKPTSLTMQSRPSTFRKYASTKDDPERASVSGQSETEVFATNGFSGADKSTVPAVQTSSVGTSAVERNIKDRSSIPSKFQMNSVTEPPSSYLHESCMW